MCEASFVNIATATSALGPCTGVTVDVSQSGLDLVKGGGRRTRGLAPRIDGLLDWLLDLTQMLTVSIVSKMSFLLGGLGNEKS